MSGFKIPKFYPGRDLNYDDAVRMLDESAAAQEESLIRLTDIEREKVTYILKYLSEDAPEADASVEKILSTIEKYRLLLEMRQQPLELMELQDSASPPSPFYRFTIPESNLPEERKQRGRNEPDRRERRLVSDGFSDPGTGGSGGLAAAAAAAARAAAQAMSSGRSAPETAAPNGLTGVAAAAARAAAQAMSRSAPETAAPNGLTGVAAAAARAAAQAMASGRSSGERIDRARFSAERNTSGRFDDEINASVRLAAAPCPCNRLPGIAGTARGVITNPEDAFNGETAVLRVFITVSDNAKQSVRYTVNGDSGQIRFYASGRHMTIIRPDRCRNGLIISGEGTVRMERPGQPECAGKTAFSLALQNTNGRLEFRMQIAAIDSCPTHDSGTVTAKITQSDMCLRLG